MEEKIDNNHIKSIIKPDSGIMKQITKEKLYFDEEGNFYFPKKIKFGGEVNPQLKIKEWWFLALTIANKEKLTKEHIQRLFNNIIGSKSNQYKIKKSLEEKGYL